MVDGEENEVGGEERRRGCGLLVLLFEGREENVKGCGERERKREGEEVVFRREGEECEEAWDRERGEREEKRKRKRFGPGPVLEIFGCAAAQKFCAVARIFNFSIFL